MEQVPDIGHSNSKHWNGWLQYMAVKVG